MAEQLADMPTQISPQALATLFPGAQAPAPPPAAAPPAAGGPLDSPDLRNIIQQQSQAGMGAFGERERASMDINKQLTGPGGLMERQAESAKGLSFHPDFHGGFLHNLGQALLTVGAATRPGQAVENVIYAQPREEYAGRAERIKSLQEEQKALSEGMTPASQLAYKPFQAEAASRRADAAMVAAQSKAQQVAKNYEAQFARIAAMKDIAAKKNETELTVQKMRGEVMDEVTKQKDVTQEDVARIMAAAGQTLLNTKFAEDPDAMGAIKRWFGITPAQAPGGEQPVTSQTPLPPRSNTPAKAGAAVPKGTVVYDPQGKPHRSDGTHPLPKGWSQQKPGA